MKVENLFSSLKLDKWYKVLTYVGGILLILSFFFEVKGITNSQLQLLSGGIFFLGMGEWKNHKTDSWIKPPNAYTGQTALITRTEWRPDLIGLLFDIIGITLIFLSIRSIYSNIG